MNISATMGQANRKKIGLSDEDLGVNVLIRRKAVFDYDVRGKKGREKMFPLSIRRKRNDDFGELIRPEDFLRAEERDEVDGQDMRQPNKHDTRDTFGKKRKWEEPQHDRQMMNGDHKRQQTNRNQRDSIDLADMSPGPEDEASEDEGGEAVEDAVAESSPSKAIFSTEFLTLNVRIGFVDFAGLHDKRSLQMLIPLIQPRKLILVGGMKDETLALAVDCRKLLVAQLGSSESAIDVYTPEVGVTVNASVDTNAWAVRLTSALVKQLTWQKVKDLRIATVTARLESSVMDPEPDAEESNKKQKLLKEEGDETQSRELVRSTATHIEVPTLDILPSNMASATRSVAQPLQVGDLRLADLRKIMLASSHTAEFKGEGTLLIDSSVIVRKTGTGRIEVESIGLATSMGPGIGHGSTFYAVKNMIYQGLAVVK